MSETTQRSRPSLLVWILLGAVAGMILAALVGVVAVALAPDNGFGDLAAATVTLVFGIPFGAVLGGIGGYWLRRRRPGPAN